VRPETPILDAVQIFYQKKVSGLCVMQGDELQGIITLTDMLALMIELLGGSKTRPLSTSGD
jgi:CBS domain-containing protein